MSANAIVCLGIIVVLWALDVLRAWDEYVKGKRSGRERDGRLDLQAAGSAAEARWRSDHLPRVAAGAAGQ